MINSKGESVNDEFPELIEDSPLPKSTTMGQQADADDEDSDEINLK